MFGKKQSVEDVAKILGLESSGNSEIDIEYSVPVENSAESKLDESKPIPVAPEFVVESPNDDFELVRDTILRKLALCTDYGMLQKVLDAFVEHVEVLEKAEVILDSYYANRK